jgi:oligoribonuclease
MAQDKNRLIWIDLEMTGLVPERDRIIEIGIVITDSQLETVAEGTVWVIHQSDEVLAGMDAWNQSTHGKSGLTEKVRASDQDEASVEQSVLRFLEEWVPKGASPMCGNSVCQDRRFLARYMPNLEDWFHYRNLDVSTLKELAKRWYPAVYSGVKKSGKHEALADVYESIEELRYYRQALFPVAPAVTDPTA